MRTSGRFWRGGPAGTSNPWLVGALAFLMGSAGAQAQEAEQPGSGPETPGATAPGSPDMDRGGPPEGADDSDAAWGMHRGLERLLEEIDVTPTQRQQIRATFERARPELRQVQYEWRRVQQQFRQALTADTIDRGRIENLRQESVRIAERASVVLTRAVVDAAQVLTPEQRRELMKRLEERHQRHHGRPEPGRRPGAKPGPGPSPEQPPRPAPDAQ